MSPASKGAVIIGASAGAFEALSVILPALPADFAMPIYVIVHMPPDKRSLLADIFASKCRLSVIEAADKEPVIAGAIYFAPPNYHMLVESETQIALSNEEEVLFSRPSIDVAFESAADVWGNRLTGIVLTGANQDGARGLKAIADAGGVTIVQDPQTAYSKAMPQAAIASCPQARVLSLSGILSYLRGDPK